MDKLKLELDVLLPQNGECERCVDRLQTSLRQQRGVAEAHVDRAGASPRLCLHYDPDLVTAGRDRAPGARGRRRSSNSVTSTVSWTWRAWTARTARLSSSRAWAGWTACSSAA